MTNSAELGERRIVSVIIPAHDEATHIGTVVRAVLAQAEEGIEVQVVVVDDGSTDGTAEVAAEAGAETVSLSREGGGGNPAAARNLGARAAKGDPLIFLDADCLPAPGWLRAFLDAHARGEVIVGGSLDLPDGLSITARCDYYCGWYLVHSRRPAGSVPHHPPPNLSVRRDAFFSTSGFTEDPPFSYTNEEREWQGELRNRGIGIFFEPRAQVFHYNRPGFANLLRRNYRWAYTAIESKSRTGAARLAWLYRFPVLTVAAAPILGLGHTAYIVGCWAKARAWEPVLMLPAILASRLAYSAGMMVGGARWLLRRNVPTPRPAPRWQ